MRIRAVVWRWTKRIAFAYAVLWLFSLLANPSIRGGILMFVFYGAFIVFWVGGQMFMFMYFMARTRQETILPGQAGQERLEDYWGQPRIVETVQQWVTLLRGTERYRKMGGKLPKGALLVGPPGSGKTKLAKAIAGSSGIPFLSLDASSLRAAWMGMGSVKVMLLFRRAKRLAWEWGASIVFIDEVDAIGGSRGAVVTQERAQGVVMGGMMGGGGAGELNTILYELDGSMDRSFLERTSARIMGLLGIHASPPDRTVFVLAATNRPDVLDPALTRAGRLNRKIWVGLPDRDGRVEIVRGYLAQITHRLTDEQIEALVDETSYATPADIKLLVTEEAPRKALFAGRDAVEMQDVMAGLREVVLGIRNPAKLSPKEKEEVAVHEAGHALLAWLLSDARLSVTIIRYGEGLGWVMHSEITEKHIRFLREYWHQLVVSIGGRAAEMVVYGHPLASVGGDYPNVMSRIDKLLSLGIWGTPLGTQAENSRRIRRMFDEALVQAGRLIEERKGLHWKLVEALKERDELEHEDIAAIFGERESVELSLPEEPQIGKEDKDNE